MLVNYFDLSLLLIFFILAYLYLNQKKEGFQDSSSSLVDPYACYPGTYWRSKTYQQKCQPHLKCRPQKLTTEGIPGVRTPDSRYRLVCGVDEHLNRHCQLIKVHDRYY